MRILVLTPIDERQLYIDAALFKEIVEINPDIEVFSVNMFADWTQQVKHCTYERAAVYALNTADLAVKDEKVCIVIGNAVPSTQFDEIFYYEDWNDKALSKIKETNPNLQMSWFKKTDEMKLINKTATAQFLADMAVIENVERSSK